MSIIEHLTKIHVDNFDPTMSILIPIIVEDNGFQNQESVPHWLETLVKWIPERQERLMYFEEVDVDVSNLFLDLENDAGWEVDDRGEQTVLRFPAYGVSVRLDSEIYDEQGDRGLFTIFCCDADRELFW